MLHRSAYNKTLFLTLLMALQQLETSLCQSSNDLTMVSTRVKQPKT